MTSTNRIFAFLSYLLLIPGWLIVLIFRRKHESELAHARQSMVINLVAVLALLVWFLVTWMLVSIPIMGPLLAWFAFALVLMIWIAFAILWLTGMIRALRGSQKPLALIGSWAVKIPF